MTKNTTANPSPNPAKPTKKKGDSMSNPMKVFLAGCVAEFYLLLLRHFYVNGTLQQVVAWDSYLTYFLYGGAALWAVGLILGIVWRKQPGIKRKTAFWVFLAGAYFTLASIFIRLYYSTALTLLCIVVPVVIILGILWNLYDREGSWSLTILSFSLIALWVAHRGINSLYVGTLVKICVVACLVILAVVALLAHRADLNDGKVSKYQLLPADADVLPIYVSCGLSFLGLVSAFFGATISYYAMWILAVVLFALAVYYTVKQL